MTPNLIKIQNYISRFKILGEDENSFLAKGDPAHQNAATSVFMAKEIMKMNFSIPTHHHHRRKI